MHFEYWKSTTDQLWYWHLRSANYEKIAQGEGYARKEDCLHAIDLVKSSTSAKIVEKL